MYIYTKCIYIHIVVKVVAKSLVLLRSDTHMTSTFMSGRGVRQK